MTRLKDSNCNPLGYVVEKVKRLGHSSSTPHTEGNVAIISFPTGQSVTIDLFRLVASSGQ